MRWVKLQTEDGKYYYYNVTTQERAWDKPSDMTADEDISPKDVISRLQQTWQQCSTPEGIVYWNNVVTEVSTWEKPISGDIWEECTTEDGKHQYWHNHKMSTSVWEKPAELTPELVKALLKLLQETVSRGDVSQNTAKISSASIAAILAVVNSKESKKDEPQASVWQECITPEGIKYWHNHKTNTSTWDKPKELNTDVKKASSIWQECVTPNGIKYWYNHLTKASTWEQPIELDEKSIAAEGIDSSTWQECSTHEGIKYWHNKKTGISTWEKPTSSSAVPGGKPELYQGLKGPPAAVAAAASAAVTNSLLVVPDPQFNTYAPPPPFNNYAPPPQQYYPQQQQQPQMQPPAQPYGFYGAPAHGPYAGPPPAWPQRPPMRPPPPMCPRPPFQQPFRGGYDQSLKRAREDGGYYPPMRPPPPMAPPPPQSSTLPEVEPRQLFFTQATIRSTFQNGKKLKETLQELQKGKISINVIPPIRVVERDGRLYSLDNRRLWVFKQLGPNARVPVQYVPLSSVDSEFWTKMNSITAGKNVVIRDSDSVFQDRMRDDDENVEELALEGLNSVYTKLRQALQNRDYHVMEVSDVRTKRETNGSSLTFRCVVSFSDTTSTSPSTAEEIKTMELQIFRTEMKQYVLSKVKSLDDALVPSPAKAVTATTDTTAITTTSDVTASQTPVVPIEENS